MYKDKIALLFIFTAFVTGLCGAFFLPTFELIYRRTAWCLANDAELIYGTRSREFRCRLTAVGCSI